MLKNDATIFKAEIYDTTKNLVNLDNQIRARISYFWFECMGIWKCPHCFVGAYFTIVHIEVLNKLWEFF